MQLEDVFLNRFGKQPSTIGRANGRVNLIGEHIDYNGGLVLPALIPNSVSVALGYGSIDTDEIYSETFQESIVRPLDSPASEHWSDYVAGTMSIAREIGMINADMGIQIVIQSDIPSGAGVSSSAAVIIATLRAIQQLTDNLFGTLKTARLAQRVENQYIGVPCGLMDQMVIAASKNGCGMALDTETFDYTMIDFPVGYQFVVLFSGVTRRLNEGRYSLRREECERASDRLSVPLLCKMSKEKSLLIERLEEPLNKRAHHAYFEHQRVKNAVKALQLGDIQLLGQLMNQSHASMRDNFEITTHEIDRLVESAREFGAIGARMTGGGFGGCIVACIEATSLEGWKQNMQQRHPKSKFICCI